MLPAITVTVASGLSRPYLARSFASLETSFETIFCICDDDSAVSTASAPAKSARAVYGLVTAQSLPLFASVGRGSFMHRFRWRSTFDWSNFSAALSRRSNGVRLNVLSRNDATRKTRFWSGVFA